jgi:hypothetical protein
MRFAERRLVSITEQAFLAELGWQYDVYLCHTGDDKPFLGVLYREMADRSMLEDAAGLIIHHLKRQAGVVPMSHG